MPMPNEINGLPEAVQGLRPARQPSDPKLWKAAGEFQEIFLGQLVKTMRTTENRSDLFEDAPGRDAFDEMFSEAIGRQMAKSGGLGLHDVMYRQLGGAYAGEADSAGRPDRAPLDQVE